MTTPVISYLTMKGGVGKTTLAANITRAMADLAPRKPGGVPTKFLLIDADAQCNLTQMFLSSQAMDSRRGRDLYEAFNASHRLFGPSDLKTQLYENKTNNASIDLIPGSFETFSFVIATPTVQSSASNVFANFMRQAREEYDFVIIDTNPSATFATLQALDVSNFLVAPITFDSFSLRGIDLIRRTLKVRYHWLANPQRILVVPNKISRAISEAQRQEENENTTIEAFPDLEPCISLSRIHASRFLDNHLGRRGLGFVADQKVWPMHKAALSKVVEDFSSAAKALRAALKGVGYEAKDENVAPSPTRTALENYPREPLDGPQPFI